VSVLAGSVTSIVTDETKDIRDQNILHVIALQPYLIDIVILEA